MARQGSINGSREFGVFRVRQAESLMEGNATDIMGSPVSTPHGVCLDELNELGLHLETGFSGAKSNDGYFFDESQPPFDEAELPSLYYEAGAYHSLGCLPCENPRFMLPGDLSALAVPYRDKVAEELI